jgi:Cdc6-like AAA superfamily ATPase
MFKTRENALSCELAPLDNQVHKTDDPLPEGHISYIFCGKKGSGKSTLILNLLKRKTSPYHRRFDNIYMISPTAMRDPKFDKLIEELQRDGKFYEELNEENINNIIEKIKAFNDKFAEEFPKKKPFNLLLLDDCIHMMPTSTQQSTIQQLWTNQRHLKLSIFLATQKLNKLPTLCRANADLISFFPNDNRKEFECLENEWSIDPKLLKSVYDFATDSPNSFLHISFFGRKPTFFKKFDRIILE